MHRRSVRLILAMLIFAAALLVMAVVMSITESVPEPTTPPQVQSATLP